MAWWLDREVGKVDLGDPRQISAAEAGFRRILRVLPEGGLREYVRREAKERLRSVPQVPAAEVRTDRQVDACRWAERRALRLYLLSPDSRPALSDVEFTDPANQWGRQLLHALEGMGTGPEALSQVFARTINGAPEEVQHQLLPLVDPIPEVRRVVEANPVDELQAALKILSQCADQG